MTELLLPYRVLSLVGNAKNAGKTTALNAMLRACSGSCAAATSVGFDGEERDTLSGLPKPRVLLPEGSLAATAEDCLTAAEAGWELLASTGTRTPLGRVLIVRITRAGHCPLAGPSSATGMRQAADRLLELGARRVFIDGAFFRGSHAAASEALVFVAGAHRSPRMQTVVRGAAVALKRFAIPRADARHAFLADERSPGWLDREGGWHSLGSGTALGRAEALLADIPGEAAFVFVPGAVGDAFIAGLVRRRRELNCGLIVSSPLSLVAGDEALEQLFLLDRPLRALRTSPVAFVAANPVSPAGWRFDNAAFLNALRELTSLPVINVLEA